MTTIAEQIIVSVAARLRDLPEVPADENVRRDHLTPASRDECPLIDVRMGDDLPDGKATLCSWTRKLSVDIAIQVRADESNTAADPIVAAVVRAMNPATPYPFKAIVSERGIRRPVPEIADADAHEIVIGLDFRYECSPWEMTEQNADS